MRLMAVVGATRVVAPRMAPRQSNPHGAHNRGLQHPKPATPTTPTTPPPPQLLKLRGDGMTDVRMRIGGFASHQGEEIRRLRRAKVVLSAAFAE